MSCQHQRCVVVTFQIACPFSNRRSDLLCDVIKRLFGIANQQVGKPLVAEFITAVIRRFCYPVRKCDQQVASLHETELFFESILRENRSVLDLLNANYTFVNERLAKHYGIPNVYGTQFRRVTLRDQTRMGLLGQGSILTVTSYPNRTSPVLRGKWILENILGTPPPPPPPNVPPLKENEDGVKPRSVRELMEEHRKNPA